MKQNFIIKITITREFLWYSAEWVVDQSISVMIDYFLFQDENGKSIEEMIGKIGKS